MSKWVFLASLLPEEEGGFSVSFHNVPGAITQGDTLEDAIANAQEALQLIIEDQLERGEKVQDDSEAAVLLADIIKLAGAIPTPITIDRPTKAARVNVTIDETLLGRIDRAAEASGRTRSGFLADAARAALNFASK